jgi:hypothetical protein
VDSLFNNSVLDQEERAAEKCEMIRLASIFGGASTYQGIRLKDGITAQDILNCLPYALKQDREGVDEPLAERYEGPAMV